MKNTKTYKYTYLDETEIEVEVSFEIYQILRQMDRRIRYNNEKNRTVALEEGVTIEDIAPHYDGDTFDVLKKREEEEVEKLIEELLERTFDDIIDQLLKLLTERQAMAYFYARHSGMKYTHIAKMFGVTESAIRKLIIKAETNLAKLGIYEIKPSHEILMWKKIFIDDRKFDYVDVASDYF
ncbi:MAG: sigma-70 region 4 domain-containing protein [Firmicutes bacterium]|nr:sigma-70 region 4 domain-containing protein [Bacillota bacterium]